MRALVEVVDDFVDVADNHVGGLRRSRGSARGVGELLNKAVVSGLRVGVEADVQPYEDDAAFLFDLRDLCTHDGGVVDDVIAGLTADFDVCTEATSHDLRDGACVQVEVDRLIFGRVSDADTTADVDVDDFIELLGEIGETLDGAQEGDHAAREPAGTDVHVQALHLESIGARDFQRFLEAVGIDAELAGPSTGIGELRRETHADLRVDSNADGATGE